MRPLRRPAASGELLSFRLTVSDPTAVLKAFVHQPLKHGGHSPGRREIVTASLKHRFPECKRALIALEAGFSTNNTVRALETLRGFPHLFSTEDPGQPTRARTGVEMSATSEPEGAISSGRESLRRSGGAVLFGESNSPPT